MPAACPNCGSALVRSYCAECGQAAPRPGDYSLRAYAAELAEQATSTDGKLGATAWALVARPGQLTVDHLQGRRARYLRPLQLFLLVNVLLFVAAPQVPLFSYSLEKYLRFAPPSPVLVTSLVERATRRGADADGAPRPAFATYQAAFDARVEAQRKSLIVLFAPAVALLLWLLFAWRAPLPGVPRRYGEHLVFALHALAFVWLALAAVGLGAALTAPLLGRTGAGRAAIAVGATLVLACTPAYLLLALRRAYSLRWAAASGATVALLAAFLCLLVAYRGLLFFTTYYTL